MTNPEKHVLTLAEIRAGLADSPWSDKPILTIKEASDLTRTPVKTLYDWRSRGLLDDCSARPGRKVIFYRDLLVLHIFTRKHEPK
jgi:hypothetical protein